MPDFKAILLVALAIVPGLLGEKIYRVLVGVRWGENQIESLARMVGFTLSGLVLYAVAYLFGAPEPTYVFPSLISAIIPEMYPRIAFAYGGHCLCSGLSGAAAAGLVRVLARFSMSSPFPCGWDHFVRRYVPGHWVAVGLETGEAYVGILAYSELSVEQKERDIILAEPALYDEETKDYRSVPYSHIFLPAALIWSVAVIENPGTDRRLVPVNESPFLSKEKSDDKASAAQAPAEASAGSLH
jgi:hypothetical protein